MCFKQQSPPPRMDMGSYVPCRTRLTDKPPYSLTTTCSLHRTQTDSSALVLLLQRLALEISSGNSVAFFRVSLPGFSVADNFTWTAVERSFSCDGKSLTRSDTRTQASHPEDQSN